MMVAGSRPAKDHEGRRSTKSENEKKTERCSFNGKPSSEIFFSVYPGSIPRAKTPASSGHAFGAATSGAPRAKGNEESGAPLICATQRVAHLMGAERPTAVPSGGVDVFERSDDHVKGRPKRSLTRSVKIPRSSISALPLALWASGARQSGAAKRERGLSAPARKL